MWICGCDTFLSILNTMWNKVKTWSGFPVCSLCSTRAIQLLRDQSGKNENHSIIYICSVFFTVLQNSFQFIYFFHLIRRGKNEILAISQISHTNHWLTVTHHCQLLLLYTTQKDPDKLKPHSPLWICIRKAWRNLKKKKESI